MNEGTPTTVTHQPFQAPRARPTAIATGTASNGSTPDFTVSQATTTPTSATAEPTEMSKLRVTMSMTALIAAKPGDGALERHQREVPLRQEDAVGEPREHDPGDDQDRDERVVAQRHAPRVAAQDGHASRARRRRRRPTRPSRTRSYAGRLGDEPALARFGRRDLGHDPARGA